MHFVCKVNFKLFGNNSSIINKFRDKMGRIIKMKSISMLRKD